MAAGLAGGIASDSALGGGTGAGAGKNAVENNYLSKQQRSERDKEFDACKGSTPCQLKVGAKWNAISVAQDAAFGTGMLAGILAGLYDSVEGIAHIANSPPETYEALKSLFNSSDVLDNVSDALKQSYIDRINQMEMEYQKVGASGSFNAGVEGGKLVTDIVGLLAVVPD